MSIRIVKQGLLDTMQDAGRYGYQHWGINPGGAADNVSHTVANVLAGNNTTEAVIELHYPACAIQFEEDALVALSGANFSPVINGEPVPLNTPIIVNSSSILEFTKPGGHLACYLSINGGFKLDPWLGSYSTNTRAGAGGYKGRKLKAGDVLFFKKNQDFSPILKGNAFLPLGWKAAVPVMFPKRQSIRVSAGNEYDLLCGASKDILVHSAFTVTPDTDRMGCRLSGIPLQIDMHGSLVSAGVTAGTIQLLPSGQLIILAADHQATGGYPRIAHIISADRHLFGHLQPGEVIHFELTDIKEAERLFAQQHHYLQQLQNACTLRLENFFAEHALY
ncbi:MAG TPA: biotin-dependent carboxyltransferase family protein [Chitinophagaceae bacterium]|nr:biotin-dependent carboxyltransferase family protein [Chitinophagaceae bacterium]